MKPNAKGRGAKKAPAKRKPTTAPKPKQVATAADDQKPEGTAATEAPAPTSPPEAQQEPAAPSPAAPPPPPAPAAKQEPKAATIATPEKVRVGGAVGILARVPIGVVLGSLGKSSLERIDALRGSPSISNLAKRMRVTDGRCAPVFLTQRDARTMPDLFAGLEAIAAAMDIGLPIVSVVSLAAEHSGVLQGHLTTIQHSKPEPSEEDFLTRDVTD